MEILISFISCLFCFIAIGVYAVRNKRNSISDYYVASREVSAPFVGISAVVSLLNGFMFFGVIGATYVKGMSFIWFFIASMIVHILSFNYLIPKFSRLSSEESHVTYISYFSKGFDKYYRYVAILLALLVILFFGIFASSQLLSGAKTLNFFYDIDNYLGGLFVILIVIIYCYAGGIRASIWTDVAQSIVMLIAISSIAFVSLREVGGYSQLMLKLENINPNLVTIFFTNDNGGWFTTFMSWMFLFFGAAIGLPHLMVRYMVIKDPKKVKTSGVYYVSYLLIFYIASMTIGLCARILIPEGQIIDKEFSLLIIAKRFLSDYGIGIILAGIFASIISTVDSMVLVCSSAITKDLFPKMGNKYNHAKYATIIVASIVYLTFLFSGNNVYYLVILAASLLGSIFAPLVILKIYNKKPSEKTVLSMIIISVLSVLLWRSTGLHKLINECLIAIPIAFAVYGLSEIIPKLKRNISTISQKTAIGE